MEDLEPNVIIHKKLNILIKENKILMIPCLIPKIQKLGDNSPFRQNSLVSFSGGQRIFHQNDSLLKKNMRQG